MRNEIVTFLSSEAISINDPNATIRRFLRRLYGGRNLREFLLTTSTKRDKRSRPKLEDRDEKAFEIAKCKLLMNIFISLNILFA